MLSLRLVRSLRTAGVRCTVGVRCAATAGKRGGASSGESLQARISSMLSEVKQTSKKKKTEGRTTNKLYEQGGILADERAQEQLPRSPPSIGSSTHVVGASEKVMIFIDGTWLFYNLHKTKGATNKDSAVVAKFGKNWDQEYAVDWSALPRLVSSHVAQQMELHSGYKRHVDVKRTVMYTAAAADTQDSDSRKVMIHDCMESNFDVTCFVTRGSSDDERNGTKIKEKCVDIGLAVDMLYMAFAGGAADAYDTAVLLTGDKDFIPAMEKTRLVGKKVVLCSMRSSCSKDLARREMGVTKIRDFDVLWLDDHLDKLFVKKNDEQITQRIIKAVERIIDDEGEVDAEAEADADDKRYMSFRQLGRRLSKVKFEDNKSSLLDAMKRVRGSMFRFFEANKESFVVKYKEELYPDYMICINDGSTVSSSSVYRPSELPDETDAEDDESAFFEGSDADAEGSEEYEEMTKLNLRDRCKLLGLKMSGTKAELIQRLMQHVPNKPATKKQAAKKQDASTDAVHRQDPQAHFFDETPQGPAPDEDGIAAFLQSALEGYLTASSERRETGRMLGRYLKSLTFDDGTDALRLCKRAFGGVGEFMKTLPSVRETRKVMLEDGVVGTESVQRGARVLEFALR